MPVKRINDRQKKIRYIPICGSITRPTNEGYLKFTKSACKFAIAIRKMPI